MCIYILGMFFMDHTNEVNGNTDFSCFAGFRAMNFIVSPEHERDNEYVLIPVGEIRSCENDLSSRVVEI